MKTAEFQKQFLHSGLRAALLVGALWAEHAAADSALPERAIALNDGGKNIVENAVRVRFTHTAWDYVKVTLRDTLKVWDYHGGGGFNNLVDSGYQPSSHSAGPARTTILQPRWTNSGQFMQNRKYESPGSFCNANNTVNGNARGFPSWDLQNLNREQGFYVTKGSQCWEAFNFCSKRTQPWSAGLPGLDITTPHVGGNPSAQCTVDPIYFNAYVANVYVYINILFFLFPTMYMENLPSPTGEAYDPVDRWPYTGLGGRSFGGETAGAFPTSGSYVPTNSYNSSQGSYFRPGDDTALYFNLYQMQVQGIDRDATSKAAKGASAGNTCGKDNVYGGQLDSSNEPIYFLGDVPQCLRPKMYWRSGANVNPNIKLGTGEIPHWQQCDAYDTVLLDGTPNVKKDDAEWLYPGNSAANTCGAGSTDPFNPTNAGWYGLKLDYMDAYSDVNGNSSLRNTIALQLSGKDIRIEMGLWADIEARTCTIWTCGGATGIRITRQFVTGMIQSDFLRARAKIKIYSIDDNSCVSGAGADCTGFWKGYDNNLMSPDKLIIDIIMNPASDLDLGGLTFNGAASCLINIFGYCILNMVQVLNLVSGMITDTIKTSIAPLIEDAIGGLATVVPNFNSILGDPWNLGTALIDLGIYAAGDKTQTASGSNPLTWPLRFKNGPDGEAVQGGLGGKRQVGDLRFGIGFKPIAFRPTPGANNVMTIDTAEPPLADSVYGIPKLVDPDTGTCTQLTGTTYTHGIKASGNYTYSFSTGNVTISGGAYSDLRVGDPFFVTAASLTYTILRVDAGSFNIGGGLSIGTSGTYEIRAGVITFGVSPGSISANMTFFDVSTGKSAVVSEVVSGTRLFVDQYDVVKFNGNDYKILRCSGALNYPNLDADGVPDADNYVVSGTFLDTKALPNVNYNTRDIIKEYWTGPIAKDKKPPAWCVTPAQLRKGAGGLDFAKLYPQSTWLSFDNTLDKNPAGAAVLKNTLGGWDQMPPNSVLKLNSNTGAKETGSINYDMSIHIHQRLFAEMIQAIVASGATCLDFSTQDTMGASTPWASLLSVKSFAALMPEIYTLFPKDSTVSVHITPMVTPHVRTGVGRLTYMPRERLKDPIEGPLPIANERYTLGLAVPDIRIDIIVNDSKTNTQVTMMSAYWSATFGFYAKAVRKCYKLDPLLAGPPEDQLKCNSTQVNERQVSGYYEFFVDMNSPSLNREFENGRDGIHVGQFTNRGIGTTRGEAAFVINSTLCSTSGYTKCGKLGLTQAVPTLLESLVQLFMVARFSFYRFTVDFLYVGPDGPNDDLIGGGDYLGIYGRFLGNLDVFSLLGAIALAPAEADFSPQAVLQGVEEAEYIRTNTPSFGVSVAAGKALGGLRTAESYSYRIDDGFWRTPVDELSISTGALLEGEHKLSVRAFSDTNEGAFSQVVPTVIKFFVDTVAPVVEIAPSPVGYFSKRIIFDAHDLQTPDESLVFQYSLDGAEWLPSESRSLSIRNLKAGRHALRVQATDLAGNVGAAAREIHIKSSGWGCSAASTGDGSVWMVLAALLSLGFMRRRAAR